MTAGRFRCQWGGTRGSPTALCGSGNSGSSSGRESAFTGRLSMKTFPSRACFKDCRRARARRRSSSGWRRDVARLTSACSRRRRVDHQPRNAALACAFAAEAPHVSPRNDRTVIPESHSSRRQLGPVPPRRRGRFVRRAIDRQGANLADLDPRAAWPDPSPCSQVSSAASMAWLRFRKRRQCTSSSTRSRFLSRPCRVPPLPQRGAVHFLPLQIHARDLAGVEDVVARVGVEDDDVRQLAGLERAHVPGEADRFGA